MNSDMNYFLSSVVVAKRKYPLCMVSASKMGITLTSIQEEILVGTLLGDSHLERAKPSHNA
jgi:hypothetical protein